MCKICKRGDWWCHTLNLIKLHQVQTMQQRSWNFRKHTYLAIKIIYSLHFPMATNSFPLPSKLISINYINSVISSSKNIKQYNYIFFSEIYILKYPPPLFLFNTLFVNWKLSFLYWELNCNTNTDLLWVLEIGNGFTRYCTCTPSNVHGKLSARICCNLHQMSLITRWHTDTHMHINTSFIY